MDLFLVLCKEDEHKNRGLTLLHERWELLMAFSEVAAIAGNRRLGVKSRVFSAFSSSPFLSSFLSVFLAFLFCSCALPRHTTKPCECVVLWCLWCSAPVVLRWSILARGSHPSKRISREVRVFFCFKQQVRFFL
jgi:hypothetical protein